MARYLTPSKVCLLTVMAMYCDGHVPQEGTIPVLSFLTSRLVPETQWNQNRASTPAASTGTSLDDFRNVLKPYKKQGSEQSLWDVFVSLLWKLNSLDAFFDFFQSLPGMFRPRPTPEGDQGPSMSKKFCLSRSSLFGAFVRQAGLEFDRLTFPGAVILWQNYERFRSPTEPAGGMAPLLGEHGKDAREMDAMNEASNGRIYELLSRDVDEEDSDAQQLSTQDVERLLNFQIDQMQKFGNRLPASMCSNLADMVILSPEVSSLSRYASFLESWYAGDYHSSFENLHRYYDYAMHNKDRSQYQYALLNLAILQANFGCFGEAITAMHETIATARENKDMACLNFSLSWLYHFRTVHGSSVVQGKEENSALLGSQEKSLAFLKTKAKEVHMWSIVSSTLLNEARLYLSQGRLPQEAFVRIYESSHLNVQHNISSVTGTQLLVQSSLFGRLGIESLSSSYTNLVYDAYGQYLPAEDIVRARCRSAYISALSGNYKAAEKSLQSLEPAVNRNLQFHQSVSIFTGIIKLQRALHHNDLALAELLLSSLKAAPSTDIELRFQISLLEIDYLARCDDLSTAFKLIEHLLSETEPEGVDVQNVTKRTESVIEVTDALHRTTLLSKKAMLFVKGGRPQKGLSLALRSVVAAQTAKVLPPLWQAVAILAQILVSMGEPEAGQSLMDAVVYQASETGDVALTALLQSTLVDAAMGVAAKTRNDRDKLDTCLRNALVWIKRCSDSFSRIEDVLGQAEMAAKAGVVMKLIGDEKGSAEQLRLCKELEQVGFARA